MNNQSGRKSGGKSGRGPGRMGEAVCDIKGDLWDLDAGFLMQMKQLSPGWFGGSLPDEVMQELKNTGRFYGNGLTLTAQPKDDGRIQLSIRSD